MKKKLVLLLCCILFSVSILTACNNSKPSDNNKVDATEENSDVTENDATEESSDVTENDATEQESEIGTESTETEMEEPSESQQPSETPKEPEKEPETSQTPSTESTQKPTGNGNANSNTGSNSGGNTSNNGNGGTSNSGSSNSGNTGNGGTNTGNTNNNQSGNENGGTTKPPASNPGYSYEDRDGDGYADLAEYTVMNGYTVKTVTFPPVYAKFKLAMAEAGYYNVVYSEWDGGSYGMLIPYADGNGKTEAYQKMFDYLASLGLGAKSISMDAFDVNRTAYQVVAYGSDIYELQPETPEGEWTPDYLPPGVLN